MRIVDILCTGVPGVKLTGATAASLGGGRGFCGCRHRRGTRVY